MVDKRDDSTRNNLRDALSPYVEATNGDLDLSSFLIVFFGGDCVISSKWYGADHMVVQTSPSDESDSNEFKDLHEKIRKKMGSRLSLTI